MIFSSGLTAAHPCQTQRHPGHLLWGVGFAAGVLSNLQHPHIAPCRSCKDSQTVGSNLCSQVWKQLITAGPAEPLQPSLVMNWRTFHSHWTHWELELLCTSWAFSLSGSWKLKGLSHSQISGNTSWWKKLDLSMFSSLISGGDAAVFWFHIKIIDSSEVIFTLFNMNTNFNQNKSWLISKVTHRKSQHCCFSCFFAPSRVHDFRLIIWRVSFSERQIFVS